MIVLANTHISAESAYVVDDYPYGFKMRCKIRYWLECKRDHGVRAMSQTTNPKRGGIWNKPKAGTYWKFGAAMFFDGDNHVQFSGLSEYTDFAESKAWVAKFGDGVPEEWRGTMYSWLNAKIVYETRRDHKERFAAIQQKAVDLGVVLKIWRGKFRVTHNADKPEVFVLCENIDDLESHLATLAA